MGLLKIRDEFQDTSTIVEVGVGTGVIPVVLSKYNINFQRYYGYDVDNLVVKVADINIDTNQLSNRVTVAGGVPLFSPEKYHDRSHPYANMIIANIPQVPSLSTGPLRDMFDYYQMPSNFDESQKSWAMRGLLLIAQILQDGDKRLYEDGIFVLNIGVRTLIDNIDVMISDLEYESEIIYKDRIMQDPETDISAFVHFEDTENEHYTFYADKISKSANQQLQPKMLIIE